MRINEISENISHTSKRLRDIEREKKVKPGSDEWFKLWFSLPYLKEAKENISVNGKTYPITGNIQDEIGAKTNESIENFNPQDPMSSSVLIQGYGTANLSTLMKNITNSIKQLGELRNDPDGFRQLKYALYDNEVLKAKLNALVTALDQLQEIKRKGGKRSVNIQKENISEETGKEMLKIFKGMHHDKGMNKDMNRFILSNDWELRDFTPDMFPSEEEFFDYDDPFDRIIDIDYSHRVNLSAPIIVGPQFSDGKYSVIDGNHRAAAAQRMGKTIKGYFPVKKTTEARTFQPQMSPMQDLVAEYQMFSSFGQMGLSDYAKSPDSAEKIKEVIRTLSQSNKNLQNLDNQALEKNKNKILTHIHDMMNYAIAHFREHLKPEQFDAKKQQINKLLTKYNNITSTNENFADEKIVEKVAWQDSLSKKLFDFEGDAFSSLESRFPLPINSSVLKRLGADEVRATVFHVTSYDNLDTMIKNQNTQKALSTFFYMNPEKFTSGVETSGGLVFELDANVLLASNVDIDSQVDDSGRRWIPMEYMSQNTGEFDTSDLIDEVPELLSQLVKKYTNKNSDEPYGAWKKLGQSLNQKGDGKTLNLLIKDFFDGIYKIYLKHKDEIMKLLRVYLSDRTAIDYYGDWDEIISNNYKIKKIHVINTPELNKNPEILRNIKSTGISYDIWNTGSKLSSHVKKTVDKEKAEYIAKQEKDNPKPKSNFVIKSPGGFMWDEFRIFNLNNNGKIDLGSAIAKLSPEEQEWAKLRWQQGLRLGDIGKKYNLNNTQAIQKYQPIHDKIRQHLGIKESIFSNLQSIEENFADGKNPGRKGLAKRMGVNTKASVSSLRKTAKNSSGEKQRMAHWLANMKAGREK